MAGRYSALRTLSAQGVSSDVLGAEILLNEAQGLLAEVGYRAGRVRKTHTARTSSLSRCDIRAPGPTPPPGSVPLIPPPLTPPSAITETFELDRCATAFRRARTTHDPTVARVATHWSPDSLHRTHRSAVTACQNTLSAEERLRLRNFANTLKQQQRKIVENRLERRFRRKEKLGLFDAQTNRTRLETSKIADFDLSLRYHVNPKVKRERERCMSTTPQPPKIRDKPRDKLKNLLESTIVDRTRATTGCYATHKELSINFDHVHWLAREGIARFIPSAKQPYEGVLLHKK